MTQEGLALYNWRMKNSLSQQQAAHWLGISCQTVANIEAGRTNPSKKTSGRIRKVIGNLNERAVEEVSETPENANYVPFTERLANAYPELQKKFDNEVAIDEAKAKETSENPNAQRLLGFLEGVAMATGVDMSKQIAQFESLLL